MKVLKILGIILLAALLLILAVVLFLYLSPKVGKGPGRAERENFDRTSAQHADGAFRNEQKVGTLTGGEHYAGTRKTPETLLPAEEPAFLPEPGESDLTFTWFGHSSFLLQIGGQNVLVDPVLSKRSSPVSFVGPKRFSELPLTAEELPDIDVLFLSHDHYDHLDYRTIRAVAGRVGAFVVPLGLDAVLRGWGIPEEKIRALDWWESAEIGSLRFTLTPSQHFSGRNPLRANSTLWGGLYLSSGDHRVYYTGDGGYYGVFTDVRERLGAPDLMIAECGQYDPSWAGVHMFPEQTAQAGIDAGAAWLIPVHWGSFCICNHDWDDSIRRVTAAAEASGLPLATPRIGQTVDYSQIASFTEAWWEQYR